MSNFWGFSFTGKVEDFDTSLKLQKNYVTVRPLGPSNQGMDTFNYGLYRHTTDAVVEAGSTDSVINLTAHSAKRGDIVRVKTTSNSINEREFSVKEVTANTITLDGVASANFATGDTVDILTPMVQRYDDTGASLASVVSPPLRINRTSGGSTVETIVHDDLDDPSNSVPIPVRLYGSSANITLTAEQINVQLSHTGANPDSVQIGDGTETAAVNASNELQVRDDDLNTALGTLNAKDFSTETTLAALNAKFSSLGQKAMAASTPVVIATDQSAININNIGGTVALPTGAATEAKQDTVITALGTLNSKDFATQTTLSALNSKFSSLGQKASASSAPVVLSSEQETILDAIKTAVEVIDNAISGTEMQVDLVSIGGAATEVTLSAINAKLPAALGQQNKAGSVSVTIASDQEVSQANLDMIENILHDFSSTAAPTGAWTEIIDSTAGDCKKLEIFYSNGEPLELAVGASGFESERMWIVPGKSGIVEIAIPGASRIAVKPNANNVSSGYLILNIMG